MRDALSILDQAIASCDGRLTAETRYGNWWAPRLPRVLEEVMQAVARRDRAKTCCGWWTG